MIPLNPTAQDSRRRAGPRSGAWRRRSSSKYLSIDIPPPRFLPCLLLDPARLTRILRCRVTSIFAVALAIVLPACRQPDVHRAGTVTARLEKEATSDRSDRSRSQDDRSTESATIAWVNRDPVSVQEFDALLREAHGLAAIEQLIGLELAQQEAQRRGIEVTQTDIDAEYERSILEIAHGILPSHQTQAARELGEHLLAELLRRKNVSSTEFRLAVRRNAYFRKGIAGHVVVGDDEVEAAFRRRYGPRAYIQQIVLRSPGDVSEVRRRLNEGQDFATLARDFSVDATTARPVAQEDPEVPQMVREIVFGLKPGEISETLRMDNLFYLFRLQRFSEAEGNALTPVLAEQLRSQLQEGKIRQRMRDLEQRLFRQADIRIEDEALEGRFREKYKKNF